MGYRIVFEPDAVEHLEALLAWERAMVVDEVPVRLAHQPDLETRNRKRLRPNPLAPWALRLGDLRVFYDVTAPSIVRVVAVGRKVGNRLFIGREEVVL